MELANAANYLNMPVLQDACCEVIAITLRKKTADATKKDPRLTEVSQAEDK